MPLPRALAQARFADYPFTLGVASGYPRPNGVVLWTRLAPRPLEGGGMPPQPVEVAWEVATDEAFRNIVRRGEAVAAPELAHSVHVEVPGLEPGRWYWYRFHAGSAASPVGRTRTAPDEKSVAKPDGGFISLDEGRVCGLFQAVSAAAAVHLSE